MGYGKLTEVSEKHIILGMKSTEYWETKLYNYKGDVVATGTGATKQESIANAYKNRRENG